MHNVSAITPTCKPHSKPARRATLKPLGDGLFSLIMTIGRKQFASLLCRVSSDFGDGFRLTKVSPEGGEEYDVHLSDEGHTCECMGFLCWGTPCKHIACLVMLRERNLI